MMMAHRPQKIGVPLRQEPREELPPRLRMRLLRRIGPQNELPYIMQQRRPFHALAQIFHSLIPPLFSNHGFSSNILFP